VNSKNKPTNRCLLTGSLHINVLYHAFAIGDVLWMQADPPP